MRIYEGSPRQDYEEVLRSIGALLDQRGLREIMVTETPDGFVIQGLVSSEADTNAWSDPLMNVNKETYTFKDDDVARFLEEGPGRRKTAASGAGPYERTLRVIGRYIDGQKPRDIFLLEQEGSYVVRLLMGTRTGARHALAEFTSDELAQMVQAGPEDRGRS